MTFQPPRSDWMTDEHVMLEEMTTKWLPETWGPKIADWRKGAMMDRAAWNEAGEAGMLCASIPEEYGGAGGDFGHEAVLNMVPARLNMAFWTNNNSVHSAIVAHYILAYGTEEQKKRWLPKMATGEIVGALAMTEPSTGSDVQSIKTRAVKDGNVYRMTGSKTFISNGQHADIIVVACKTDPKERAKGVSLMVVETEGAEGFRRGRNLEKAGLHAADTSELFFDEVPVPPENLLGGQEGKGFYHLMNQLPQERLILAAGAVGAMEGAVALAIDYAKERETFGKTLLGHQTVAHRIAHAKTQTTVARSFFDECLREHMQGQLTNEKAAMAKYWLTDLQCEVIDSMLQVFGGYGYMMEYPIAEMWQDARVQRIYGGSNEIMKEIIARGL
ncbi:MAG: acyl-CoA dehydrogenase family protein [Pseudomonadota bacterium]